MSYFGDLIRAIFGKKEKKIPKHEVCDFGIQRENFHRGKRSLQEVEEINITHGRKKTTTSTTTLPPSSSTTSSTTIGDSSSSTTSSTTVKPASNAAVILLDFDGQVVQNTQWNTSGAIDCAYSGLAETEIADVVAGVAQDYASYNVIVTRDESVYLSADPKRRTRVIVTESWEWYCGSSPCAGGVGFIGSMFWGDNTPCFVFSSALSYGVKYIRDAATHEAGHTIGLYHQSVYDANCVKTAEYNPGNTTCDCAPNMGVSYYKTYNQWWVGPNSQGCNIIQDDNKVITSKIGLK
jgi:hypothetical protein